MRKAINHQKNMVVIWQQSSNSYNEHKEKSIYYILQSNNYNVTNTVIIVTIIVITVTNTINRMYILCLSFFYSCYIEQF